MIQLPTELLNTKIFPICKKILDLQVQVGRSGSLDNQLLNCDLQKLPCLPTVASRTSYIPSETDKIVAENNCLQSNQCINPITGVHSASVPPTIMPLMEQQHLKNRLKSYSSKLSAKPSSFTIKRKCGSSAISKTC